jgi:dTDP-L-rhamnose 4-epimerase
VSRERVLITGGAGFIGSHLADQLASTGCEVVVYDNLTPQVHGDTRGRPEYLSPDIELIVGDVRDADRLAAPLRAADVVVHLAAAVGVAQSQYQIRHYTEVNAMGAANLLQLLADDRGRVRKLLVASSMSVYGEGSYTCAEHGLIAPRLRTEAQLAQRAWEIMCPRCGTPLEPLPTSEEKPLYPTSVYAVNKRDHEELCLAVGAAYGIPTVALRFFNVYGPRQALSNPYTGVAAIFCARLLNNHPPLVYEDGKQSRDFVHVTDLARACALAIESSAADGDVINVGSGRKVRVGEIAEILAEALERPHLRAEITNTYRSGDVRHCFADIGRANRLLGYTPRVALEDGLLELAGLVYSQRPSDRVGQAAGELTARRLAR